MEGLDTGFFFDLRAGRSGAEELWRTVTERDDPAAEYHHALRAVPERWYVDFPS
ncbi:hypothetical protein GGP65_001069 [Salinibacter ruber]|uniref:hypothetical protein n=1 Tax=Salinibacter ruber TaxID=146919 RepID=UPI002169A668|nr:hypothetical protein [Salinibacter ruber]MCS3663462.1 hypothetical protein [Salinibacter ruber]